MKTLLRTTALFLMLLTTVLTVACSGNSGASTTEAPVQSSPSLSIGQSSPSILPSPSPVLPSESEKSPTPDVDPLEKKRNNTAYSSEQDINVIPVGVYEFVLEDGRKLAFDGDKVSFVTAEEGQTAKNMQFLVSFQNAGTDKSGRPGVRYVIYTGNSVKNSLYCVGSNVSVKESNDRLFNYNWRIDEQDDGTIRLKHLAASTMKYLYVKDDGELSLGTAAQAEGGAVLKMNLLDVEVPFRQYISEKGDIILRVTDKVKLKDDRLRKLTNDMQVAYETYYELTNFLPYESIVIRIYQKEPYFGYVYQGWNVISFNMTDAINDLGKIHPRDGMDINDWNFCLLHEMGHMFDWGRGWRFHGEFSTNMKVAYVLYANLDVGASAATSGYSASSCFDGTNIVEMWKKPKMTEFNLDRVLYLFVSYAQEIGWDNVKKAYQEIQAMPKQESNQLKCLELFTDTMAKYAPDNKHVKDTFEAGEWDILVEEIS